MTRNWVRYCILWFIATLPLTILGMLIILKGLLT